VVLPQAAVSRSELRGTAALVAAVVIWGATFTLSKLALRHLAPTELAFLRQAFGLPPVLWLAWRARSFALPLRYAVPLSATGMVGFFLFANLGLDRASASVGALVQGLAPVVIAVLAVTLLRERLTVAVAGGTLRVESGLGLAFLFLSVVSFASYTVLGRRLGDRVSAVQATVIPVCLSVVVFAFGPVFEPWRGAGAATLALAAALGFFGSGVSYAFWSFGIARVPATRAGVLSNLVPVVAVLLAWLALDETLGIRQAVGGAVVIAGAVVASGGARRVRVGRD
jgi:drug/metabolite transporter (DMT)-like permease